MLPEACTVGIATLLIIYLTQFHALLNTQWWSFPFALCGADLLEYSNSSIDTQTVNTGICPRLYMVIIAKVSQPRTQSIKKQSHSNPGK